MKNIYKKWMSILVAALILLTLTGCGQGSENVQREDVFDIPQNDGITTESNNENNNNENILKSIETSVKDEKRNYEYNGEDVVIGYQYRAEGLKSVGIMVLCDGIATPFHTDRNGENKILHCIELEDGSRENIDLCFVPYGKDGENVSVEIVDIIHADYDVSVGEKDSIINDFIYGRKYSVNYISGICIAMKEDGAKYGKDFYNEYLQNKISKKDKKDADIYGTDGISQLDAAGKVNGSQSLWYTVSRGEQLDIEISYFGGDFDNILTSVYVDGELYPAFDGNEYAECPVDKDHFTTINGRIETSGLEKGRHTVFSMCGNVEYNKAVPLQSFVIEVK